MDIPVFTSRFEKCEELTLLSLDETLKSFVWDLGKSGFVLQLISLAGLHSTATVTGARSSRKQWTQF